MGTSASSASRTRSKCKWHRALPSNPSSAILTRQNGKWFVVFHVEVAEVEPRQGDTVSIDFGLSSLIALSNGETIARPNWIRRAAKACGADSEFWLDAKEDPA